MAEDDVIDAPLEGGNPDDTQNAPKDPATDDAPLGAGGGKPDGPVAAPADWPEDWRAKMSGEDKDALKVIERYKSPADVAKALREAQKKISSGQVRPQLAKDATDADIAAYRKELGIPEKADGYLEALPNGLVIGDGDKEIASSFLETAHAANMPPEFVGAALDWYYKSQEDQVTAMKAADKEYRASTEDDLRSEWGGEYRANINSVKNFLDSAPVVGQDEDGKDITLGDLLRGSRSPDGRLLGDHPAFLRWAAEMATSANPAGFVAPSGGGSQADSVADEIEKLETYMRDDRLAYNKDEKAQARLRQLYDAQAKLASH